MKNRIHIHYIIAVLLFISFISYPAIFYSQANAEQISPSEIEVIERAEYFFSSIRDRNFERVWSLLSAKSQKEVIDEIMKSSKKMGGSLNKEAIKQDFSKKGNIFINYWNAFANSFNTNMILNDSRWEIGYVKDSKAQIIITYKKSTNPANLKLFKEKGTWRVGLAETFWTRKY